jgi:hypothetical protein
MKYDRLTSNPRDNNRFDHDTSTEHQFLTLQSLFTSICKAKNKDWNPFLWIDHGITIFWKITFVFLKIIFFFVAANIIQTQFDGDPTQGMESYQ